MTAAPRSRLAMLFQSKNIYLVAIILIIWEAAARYFKIKSFLLPLPSAIAMEFYHYPGFFLAECVNTLWTTLAGLALAVIVGVGFGIAVVYYKTLEDTVYRLMVAVNAVPKVALAPLFVIWFGTGPQAKIAISAMIAIFPIIISTVMGLKSIDPEMLNMAFAGHASKLKTLRKIRLPNALPEILSGTKVASSFALVGAIVGEFVAGDTGLGHVILVAQGEFDTARVFVSLVLLGVLGSAIFMLIELAERKTLSWHVSQRSGSSHVMRPAGA